MEIQSNGSDQGQLIAELAALRAENEKLKAKAEARLTHGFKVSPKGGVSIYGFGRFPITLYREQITRLAKIMPELLAFVEANSDSLKFKE